MKRWRHGLIDPPWFYNQRGKWSTQTGSATRFGGGASDSYPLMRDKDLLALAPELGELFDPHNAAVHVWATNPRKDLAIEFIKRMGFRYVTEELVWLKLTSRAMKLYGKLPYDEFLERVLFKGTGYYTMSNVEPVLLGVRGSIKPKRKVGQVLMVPHPRYPKGTPPELGPDGKLRKLEGKIIHSRKPEEARARLVEAYGLEGGWLEVFARIQVPGFDAIGNQIDGRDIRQVLEERRLHVPAA